VAEFLVDLWLSPQVLHHIARDLPNGVDDVRVLARWLASVHDVGKASPAFAVQVPRLCDHMRNRGLSADPRLEKDPERSAVSHALVGHVAVLDRLVERHGFSRRGVAAQLAGVVGSHHGVTPENGQLQLVRGRPDLTGTGVWVEARSFFLDRATERIGGGAVLERYRDVVLSKPSQVLLTAIVIVADWIASNADLFPIRPLTTLDDPPVELDESAMRERAEIAWAELDLTLPWKAQRSGSDVDQLFRERFTAKAAGARPVQVAAFEVASAQDGAAMLIVEAPMGAGKTEAALLAAEVLAEKSGADGCFVALPTQATTDAMFGRVRAWLDVLPGRDGPVSVTLAHGKAALNEEYEGLVRRGRYSSIGDEIGDEGIPPLIAHQWFSGRKKSVLASFVVGTVDQVLFGGLKSRHLMLRHLGLAGKVVIIDEVHAYDVYMSQYLNRVLHWLGAYGVPVVLLSATLPADRRAALLNAYEEGTGSASRHVPQEDLGYPVVLSTGDNAPPRLVPIASETTDVRLDHLADDLDTLVSYLREHLAEGGCAVVVRNTVTRVQETAERLEAEFGVEHVTVNHSRFLSCDRARTDRGLLDRFGPPGDGVVRPPLHVVVASQVVEQSLDVDFDLMVTDLAPADLVLQRIGRLHRHERVRPAPVRKPRCALVGVTDWAAGPVEAHAGSQRVYGEHNLLRSAALLGPPREGIVLPTDISPLVQRAYGSEPVGPASWQPAMRRASEKAEIEARKRTEAARTFLLDEAVASGVPTLVGWTRGGVGEPEVEPRGLAQVRDGEESLEVLVVQRDADGGLVTPDWIGDEGGQQIPLDSQMRPALARTIAACGLRLPLALCHPGVIDDVISVLEDNRFTSFHQSPLLKGHLVLVLDQARTAEIERRNAHFHLTYDPRRGLVHERR
jgi:CRISPR-associated helicase Cas3/CRISPR-associated endonuclease Cas3-HD